MIAILLGVIIVLLVLQLLITTIATFNSKTTADTTTSRLTRPVMLKAPEPKVEHHKQPQPLIDLDQAPPEEVIEALEKMHQGTEE